MAKTLKELNDYLFDEIEILKNPALKGEELECEIVRAHAISKLAERVIDSGNLVLRAQELVGEYNDRKDVKIPNYLLGNNDRSERT